MNSLRQTEVSKNNSTQYISQYQIHRKCTVAFNDIELAKKLNETL